jgi:hypothetical protein
MTDGGVQYLSATIVTFTLSDDSCLIAITPLVYRLLFPSTTATVLANGR